MDTNNPNSPSDTAYRIDPMYRHPSMDSDDDVGTPDGQQPMEPPRSLVRVPDQAYPYGHSPGW